MSPVAGRRLPDSLQYRVSPGEVRLAVDVQGEQESVACEFRGTCESSQAIALIENESDSTEQK